MSEFDLDALTAALFKVDLDKRPSQARRRSWGLYRDDAAAIARAYAREIAKREAEAAVESAPFPVNRA